MTEIVVMDAVASDVAALAERMRATDAEAATARGINPRRLLWLNFRFSLFRHTAFVDDEIAAMWGVRGPAMGGVGEPWLVGTQLMDRYPMTAVRMSLDELAAMRAIWPTLRGLVVLNDRRACRFAEFLGAAISQPDYTRGVATFEIAGTVH
ncbi:MAG TPA: hypothetical protein VNG33_06740 [Polyangiaceae bacterium]|nr:hypothetical protein [Polyangiaceae bacterium]